MSLVFNTPKTGLNTATRNLQNMGSGSCKLTDVSVEYTKNGDYSVELPEGYDGFSSVDVKVNVSQTPQGLDFSVIGYGNDDYGPANERLIDSLEYSRVLFEGYDPNNTSPNYHPFSETDIEWAPNVDISNRTDLRFWF